MRVGAKYTSLHVHTLPVDTRRYCMRVSGKLVWVTLNAAGWVTL
jgi:hypothetical protein